MKFTTTLFTAALIATVSSIPIKRNAIDPALVPSLGFTAGKNPDGTGNCDGAVNGADGKPIKVPCSCPPDQNTFVGLVQKNVDAGKVVNNPSVPFSFPTDDSTASQLARVNAALVTLQNFNGEGKGCPASSTTLSAQQKALQDGASTPAASPAAASAPASSAAAPAPAPAPSAAAPAASPAAGATLTNSGKGLLLPPFGIQPNTNPTGTGDCDGANGPDGKPIKIPCACPPDVNTFLTQLDANVAAGHAVKNPSVAVSFPEGDDNASKSARITAALITLQNLNGPGKGCPASSTNYVADQKALGN